MGRPRGAEANEPALKPPRAPATDPTYDILRSERQPLAALFSPASVAVIGASEREGSVGRTVLWNLIRSPFGGTVYPVNPHRHSVLGVRACAVVSAIPEPVDLAVIATPAATVPDLIEQCAAAGVRAAIVLSAGFREVGAEGQALEARIRDTLRRSRLRLHGPNCLGLMNPRLGLNATFAGTMALRDTWASSVSRERSAPRCSTGACGRTWASAPSPRSARCSTWAGAT
ncbi:MAG: CoA-binding protein [Cyanobium sp.]